MNEYGHLFLKFSKIIYLWGFKSTILDTISTNNSILRKIFPFLNWLPLVKKTWKDDLIAGLTGTIIAIPQAVAFAMIAGMPPQYGFYLAMMAPLVAALWGASYQLITGPTTTSSIVLFSIVKNFASPQTETELYISMAITLSFMAGIVKLLMGVFKMGKLVNFVSNSVVLGFTAGAGILIAFKQLKHAFGIEVPQGSGIVDIVKYISTHISEANVYVMAVALVTLFSAIIIKNYIKKLSRLHMLIAMVIGSALGYFLGGSSVGIETVGHIPNHLPPFSTPDLSMSTVQKLFSGAIVLGILGLVEAVSIARSIALYTHQKLDANQEFIGQGLTNIITSFFSCYVGSGSFTRSGVNFQAGAKTPLAAVLAAVFLMVVVLLFGSYASYLSRPAMGGVILLVGYNLIDFKHIKLIWKSSWRELVVLAVTALGTMFFRHLEYALLAGVMFSFLFYLERTSNPHIAIMGFDKDGKLKNIKRSREIKEDPDVKIIRIDGSLYFGDLDSVSKYFANLYTDGVRKLIVMAGSINFIDVASAEWLEQEARKWQEDGRQVHFAELSRAAQDILIKGEFKYRIGYELFHDEFEDAYRAIKG